MSKFRNTQHFRKTKVSQNETELNADGNETLLAIENPAKMTNLQIIHRAFGSVLLARIIFPCYFVCVACLGFPMKFDLLSRNVIFFDFVPEQWVFLRNNDVYLFSLFEYNRIINY